MALRNPSWLHRCRLPLSPLGVPHFPFFDRLPTRRYPCWPHSGVYHSPKVATRYNGDARLIPTRCNNVLPTTPGPHTHMKPVGLALPPLPVLASYSQTQYACPVLDLGRAHKDTFWDTGWNGPPLFTTSIPPKLVPISPSHLTHLVMFIYMCVWLSLIVFQMPLKATTRFLMPPKAPT